MRGSDRYVVWSVQATQRLDERLGEAIKQDSHCTKSEFIRSAVRRELEKFEKGGNSTQ